MISLVMVCSLVSCSVVMAMIGPDRALISWMLLNVFS